MKIQKVQLQNFRNYQDLDIDFSPGVNILYGNNAQGKTNLLEAIYLAATTKSFRNNKDREMIRLGEENAHMRVFLEKAGVPHKIDMFLQAGKAKAAAIDGIRVRKSAELLGMLHTIVFSPNDISMVKNGPAERRRFVDMELCQLSPIYCNNLTNYGRILMQRNNLLQQIGFKPELKDTILVWDEQLVTYGREIIRERRNFVEELSEIVEDKMKVLTGQKESLRMVYEPDVAEEEFMTSLERSLDRDIRQKVTSHGPHRDDIGFFINELNVKQFGSQGQQRTVVLALKLSEIHLVRNKIKDSPVLLLDDVLSELDRSRQTQLLMEIKDVQTIVTCTGMEEFVNYRAEQKKQSIFYVNSGTIVRKE